MYFNVKYLFSFYVLNEKNTIDINLDRQPSNFVIQILQISNFFLEKFRIIKTRMNSKLKTTFHFYRPFLTTTA
jgi:hypothetical protein